MSDYKPTEHGNLRKDGEVDQRTQQTEFAHGKVDPVEAGKQGGSVGGSQGGSTGGSSTSQGGDYKPTENDGLRKDGQPDGRVKGN